jgi:hypothetical protein
MRLPPDMTPLNPEGEVTLVVALVDLVADKAHKVAGGFLSGNSMPVVWVIWGGRQSLPYQ